MIPILPEHQETFSKESDDFILELVNKYFIGIPIRCEIVEKYFVIYTCGEVEEVESAYDKFYVEWYYENVMKKNIRERDIIIRYVTEL